MKDKFYTNSLANKNLQELIPKDKNDFSTMAELYNLSEFDFKKIGMKILEWFKDINWPIAKDIKNLVVKNQNVMMEYILTTLKGNDESWKYWIITNILPEISYDNISILLPKLMDMCNNPTSSEINEEVTEEIISFLHT